MPIVSQGHSDPADPRRPEGLRSSQASAHPQPAAPVSGSEVTLTPEHKEEHQHDWVEEAQDKAEDVLVHNRRHQEHSQHGRPTGPLAQKLVGKKE